MDTSPPSPLESSKAGWAPMALPNPYLLPWPTSSPAKPPNKDTSGTAEPCHKGLSSEIKSPYLAEPSTRAGAEGRLGNTYGMARLQTADSETWGAILPRERRFW